MCFHNVHTFNAHWLEVTTGSFGSCTSGTGCLKQRLEPQDESVGLVGSRVRSDLKRSIWTIPSPRISCALSQQHTSVEIVTKHCRTFQVDLTTEDCLWYICTKLINNLYWINKKKTYVLIKIFLLMTLYSVCEQTKEPSRGCRCNLNLVPTLAGRAEYIGLT